MFSWTTTVGKLTRFILYRRKQTHRVDDAGFSPLPPSLFFYLRRYDDAFDVTATSSRAGPRQEFVVPLEEATSEGLDHIVQQCVS
jgi:hypothetical protein